MALKIRYNSPVILTFSLIAVAVYFVPFLNPMLEGGMGDLFVINGIGSASDYPSLILYIFGHASLEHLMGNLTFILLLGPIIEEKHGSQNLTIMIIITALITGLLNIFVLQTGLLGASGIVFMLIVLVSFTNVQRGDIPLTFIFVALLFVGKEVLQSLDDDQISQFAHILGGVCGGVFGFINGKRRHEDQYV